MIDLTSSTTATLGMSGWLDLAQLGLAPNQKHQAFLGAPKFVHCGEQFSLIKSKKRPTVRWPQVFGKVPLCVPFVLQVKAPSSIRWEDRTGLVELEFRHRSDCRRFGLPLRAVLPDSN